MLEARSVGLEAGLGQHFGPELEREAERVVQQEQATAVHRRFAAGLRLLDPLGQPAFAGRQGLAEASLFQVQGAEDGGPLGRQLRVAVRHSPYDVLGKLRHEGPLDAQDPSEAHRTPHDSPHDVTAALVRR